MNRDAHGGTCASWMMPLIALLITYFTFAVVMKQGLNGVYPESRARLSRSADCDLNISIHSELYVKLFGITWW